jgi:hypothetical protein
LNLLLRLLFLALMLTGGARGAYAVDLGDLLTDRVPPTCEESFWDVMSARAWTEGQRQVTQNANLLAKPDSVLTYSCFDQALNGMENYADTNFPGDPDESFDESFFGSIGWYLFIGLPPNGVSWIGSIDPYLTKGLDMGSVLEILILDTIMNNVSILGATATADDVAAVACGRNYYMERSTYEHTLLGGRTSTNYFFPDNISGSGYAGCGRMAAVWDMARCYNANTEASHDSFYTLAQYTANDGNYRTHTASCTNSSSSIGDIVCDVYFHGLPAIPFALYWPWSGTPPLSWSTATAAANPAPGAPGAVEPYQTLRSLYAPTNCNAQAPIKTGVVVRLNDGSSHDDAYCMAPGCWFNPAVSTTQCQPL